MSEKTKFQASGDGPSEMHELVHSYQKMQHDMAAELESIYVYLHDGREAHPDPVHPGPSARGQHVALPLRAP